MADWGFKDRRAGEAFRRARFRKLSSVREHGRLQALQVCALHSPLPSLYEFSNIAYMEKICRIAEYVGLKESKQDRQNWPVRMHCKRPYTIGCKTTFRRSCFCRIPCTGWRSSGNFPSRNAERRQQPGGVIVGTMATVCLLSQVQKL